MASHFRARASPHLAVVGCDGVRYWVREQRENVRLVPQDPLQRYKRRRALGKTGDEQAVEGGGEKVRGEGGDGLFLTARQQKKTRAKNDVKNEGIYGVDRY